MRDSLRAGLAAAGVVALLATGCGGDDDDAFGGPEESTEDPAGTTTSAPEEQEQTAGDVSAYCAAELEAELLREPDRRSASDAEVNAWLGGQLLPLVEAAAANAPAEIADDVAIIAGAVGQAAGDGDFAVFGEPGVQEAGATVHGFDLAECGWHVQDLQTTEYSFGAIPDELPPGPISFEFENVGSEVHEMLLAKKNPGVTESVEEIVAMAEDESLSKYVAYAHVSGNPGETDYRIAELSPGEWIMICFAPIGVTNGDQVPPPGAAPHHTVGMVAEFIVR